MEQGKGIACDLGIFSIVDPGELIYLSKKSNFLNDFLCLSYLQTETTTQQVCNWDAKKEHGVEILSSFQITVGQVSGR